MPYECHYTHNINGNILVKERLSYLVNGLCHKFLCVFFHFDCDGRNAAMIVVSYSTVSFTISAEQITNTIMATWLAVVM